MYPAKFDYVRAFSVQEAVSLLQQHGEGAKLLAGGHSLLPLMKFRLAQPSVLIDLNTIQELSGIRYAEDTGALQIGAMTTYATILQNEDLPRTRAALTDACGLIGDTQVRNRGTIGGNLAHNDPASDLPAVALALEATIHTVGPNGNRTIPAEEFIVGLMETALGENEIVVMIEFPEYAAGTASAYEKFDNPASGYAICGVAAVLTPAPDGGVGKCRVAVTGAADHASRLRSVEQALEGKGWPSESDIAAACESAGEGLDFLSDMHATADYRAHLVQVIAEKALRKAAGRGGA